MLVLLYPVVCMFLLESLMVMGYSKIYSLVARWQNEENSFRFHSDSPITWNTLGMNFRKLQKSYFLLYSLNNITAIRWANYTFYETIYTHVCRFNWRKVKLQCKTFDTRQQTTISASFVSTCFNNARVSFNIHPGWKIICFPNMYLRKCMHMQCRITHYSHITGNSVSWLGAKWYYRDYLRHI